MKRIIVIGGNGSGKTTLAKKLSEITALQLVHLDRLYWTDNWTPRKRDEFAALLQVELEKDEWIIDGNMRRTLPLRLKYCDTVVYLDFSGLRCFFGLIKRLFQNHGKSRDDMGGECIERFDLRSFRFIFGAFGFNKKNRAYFYGKIAERQDVALVVLKNRKQVSRFIESVINKTFPRE